jgi:uncharacterized protein (DUF924 family)
MSLDNRNAATDDSDVARVLEFWFGTMIDGVAAAAIRKRWFSGDPDLDALCAEQFAALLDAAAADRLSNWTTTARGRLAYIVVTDQFSRHIHRGSARAFATDSRALACAKGGVALGHDRALNLDERSFFYLPFEHSESRVDQHTSVGLFSQLAAEAPIAHRETTLSALDFATRHRDIVLRFGRFPHRNAAVGRISTAEESEFLRTASHFGQ